MPLLYNTIPQAGHKAEVKKIELSRPLEELEEALILEGMSKTNALQSQENTAKAKKEAQMEERLRRELEITIKDEVMIKTRSERDDILRNAKIDAEVQVENGFAQGYDQGYEEGFQKGSQEGREKAVFDAQEEAKKIHNEAELIREQAKNLLIAAHENSLARADKNRQEIIDLSVSIASKIIQTELTLNSDIMINIVEQACKEFKRKKQVVINVNPDQAEQLEASLSTLSKICPNAELLVLRDEAIEAFGCIIESDTTILDGQITTQLENVKNILIRIAGESDE